MLGVLHLTIKMLCMCMQYCCVLSRCYGSEHMRLIGLVGSCVHHTEASCHSLCFVFAYPCFSQNRTYVTHVMFSYTLMYIYIDTYICLQYFIPMALMYVICIPGGTSSLSLLHGSCISLVSGIGIETLARLSSFLRRQSISRCEYVAGICLVCLFSDFVAHAQTPVGCRNIGCHGQVQGRRKHNYQARGNACLCCLV